MTKRTLRWVATGVFAGALALAGTVSALAAGGLFRVLSDAGPQAEDTPIVIEPTATGTDEPDEDDVDEAEVDDEDEAEVEDADDEVKFDGTVEGMGSTSWTISGVVVLVNSGTEIDEGIAVGSLVRVEAVADAAGVLTATEIETDQGEVEDDDDQGEDHHDGEVEDDDDDQGEDHHDGEVEDDDHDQGEDQGEGEDGLVRLFTISALPSWSDWTV